MPENEDIQRLIEIKKKKVELLRQIAGEAEAQQPEVGAGEAAIRGAAQGLTFGLADEVIGGAKAAGRVLTGDKATFSQAFKEERDIERARNVKAQEQQPAAFIGAEVAGSVPSFFIPGAFVARGGRAAQLLTRAAGAGAATGFGKSTKEDISGIAADVAKGAATGLATAGGLRGTGKLIGATVRGTKKVAGKTAAALGPRGTEAASKAATFMLGAAEGGATGGIVSVVARDLLKKQGKKVAAKALDKLTKTLEKSPNTNLGKFSNPLAEAAKEGPAALAAAHLAFLDDPEYRELIGEKGSSALQRRSTGE